jgi:hypothetical protein
MNFALRPQTSIHSLAKARMPSMKLPKLLTALGIDEKELSRT